MLDLEDADLGQSAEALTSSNKLASNKLASNKLASNKLASNKLAASSLSVSDPTGLMATADGRDVLSYIVACALPAGQTLTVVYSNISYSFPGEIGLAPAWATRIPTVSERRWVTACVLARTNYYGIAVAISMRGSSPALATTSGEVSGFPVDEGGFYGDLFAPAQTEFACNTQLKTYNTQIQTLLLRQCTALASGTTTICGFTLTGACSTKCTQAACVGADGLSYPEYIHVYLQNPSTSDTTATASLL